ncbi:Imm7 family immunity protein [Kribbella sp. CA-294648]|uniref:Imm7 family immunity protein n=1 Tax=Kribbella sp. CA-294648 TaxID=3239948 RepID=UPI003D8DA1B8
MIYLVYTVNGWFELASDDDREEEAVAGLQDYCRTFDGTNIQVTWPAPNYARFLTIAGNANHLRTHSADVHGLLQLVGERLPGSWGLLYEQDDERTEPPGPDAYRVTRMIRGRLQEQMDPFFSPIVPVVESLEWTPEAGDSLEAWVEYYEAVGRPAGLDGVDLARSTAVGVEWRGTTAVVTVDWLLEPGHPQYGGGPQRGVLRWGGVTELHVVGDVNGVLVELATAGRLSKVRAGAGVLTVTADRLEVEF